jgi:hypothetical protein
MKIKKIYRIFTVGENTKIKIKHVGNIKLNNNEQLTFLFKESQFDFVKKNWGFYATPSINYRLKKQGFVCALMKNKFQRLYLVVIHKSKISQFRKYLKIHNQKIIKWLHNYKHL